MNNIRKAGTSLIVLLSIGTAFADGAYAIDDTGEVYPVEKTETIRLAQLSSDESSATEKARTSPQTVKIGDEEFALIPAQPLEPDDKRLDLYFSDKVGNLEYERSSSVINVDNGRVNAGFLFSEERDTVFSGSVMLDSDEGLLPGVRLSFGSRGYVALLGVENADVFGLALGVEAELTVPVKSLPLRLSASYFYAPDVLAFGDADRIFDWDINVGLQIRDSVMVYTGVRYLQMDTRPGKREVDDRLHVGVRWTLG